MDLITPTKMDWKSHHINFLTCIVHHDIIHKVGIIFIPRRLSIYIIKQPHHQQGHTIISKGLERLKWSLYQIPQEVIQDLGFKLVNCPNYNCCTNLKGNKSIIFMLIQSVYAMYKQSSNEEINAVPTFP